MSKKYTLELTAEELEGCESGSNTQAVMNLLRSKLAELAREAKAERTNAELRLPWRVIRTGGGDNCPAIVTDNPHPGDFGRFVPGNLASANLASAAPELLELAMAIKVYGADEDSPDHAAAVQMDWLTDIQPLLERALRKVETGIPEED